MATNIYGATVLIGGSAGALDKIDGTALVEGDSAHVSTTTATYWYYLDATSGVSEDSPSIISPDTNAGTKRWILQPAITPPLLLGAISHEVTAEDANIACSVGNYFTDTVTGNITYIFTDPPAGFYVMVLELINGGDHTVTWPTSVDWPAGTAPTLTASGVDVLTFCTDDGGTTWRGVLSMGGSA